MKSGFKTPEQVEFTDLMEELRKRFGYNQNRIAKIAQCSASMVSQIVAGEKNPGKPSLELLRLEYRARTESQPQDQRKPDQLRDQLDFLERNAPPSFAAAKAAVNALHQQAVENKPDEVINYRKGKRKISSALTDEEQRIGAQHNDAVGGTAGSGESERQRATDGRTARTPGRPGASSPPAKTPPSGHGAKDQKRI